jgi:hypothetical protein
VGFAAGFRVDGFFVAVVFGFELLVDDAGLADAGRAGVVSAAMA